MNIRAISFVATIIIVSGTAGGERTDAATARTPSSSATEARLSAIARIALAPRRSSVPTPTECLADYGTADDYFVGVTDSTTENFADGQYSGLLSGFENEVCDEFSGIGSGTYNRIGYQSNAQSAFVGGGDGNDITASEGFIGGGDANNVSNTGGFIGSGDFGYVSGADAFVGAGGYEYYHNNVYARGSGNVAGATDSFVGAGDLNQISAQANGSFIGGGGYTTSAARQEPLPGNQVSGVDSFIGDGDQNTVAANDGFVGAGNLNTIASGGTDGAIAGGNYNSITGVYGAIGGGSGNETAGAFAVIPGGADNEALGAASFAAGYHAKAAHNGSFVWSDDVSGSGYATDGNNNEFIVRASGGTYVFSNEDESIGVKLAAGSGAWASTSDRNAKTDVATLDDASILAKVVALPVTSWRYKSEGGVRHLGPMAQDFYAAFRVGEDDRHITSIDEDGVALAAIKGVDRELHRENGRLAARLADVESKNAQLERRLDALAARLGH